MSALLTNKPATLWRPCTLTAVVKWNLSSHLSRCVKRKSESLLGDGGLHSCWASDALAFSFCRSRSQKSDHLFNVSVRYIGCYILTCLSEECFEVSWGNRYTKILRNPLKYYHISGWISCCVVQGLYHATMMSESRALFIMSLSFSS